MKKSLFKPLLLVLSLVIVVIIYLFYKGKIFTKTDTPSITTPQNTLNTSSSTGALFSTNTAVGIYSRSSSESNGFVGGTDIKVTVTDTMRLRISAEMNIGAFDPNDSEANKDHQATLDATVSLQDGKASYTENGGSRDNPDLCTYDFFFEENKLKIIQPKECDALADFAGTYIKK